MSKSAFLMTSFICQFYSITATGHTVIFLAFLGLLQQQQKVVGSRSTSGVMKEDGEEFEEPPNGAAASAATSASASGTETRKVGDTLLFKVFFCATVVIGGVGMPTTPKICPTDQQRKRNK